MKTKSERTPCSTCRSQEYCLESSREYPCQDYVYGKPLRSTRQWVEIQYSTEKEKEQGGVSYDHSQF